MSTTSCETSRAIKRAVGPLVLFPGAIALLLWALSLSHVNVRAMNDLGLVSVLSPWTYTALGLLTIGFCLNLYYHTASTAVLALHVAAFVLIIHGTPQILYGTLRYAWAWKHIAVIDYIQRNGFVDPYAAYLDVYHNWPGFFALNALITDAAGLKSAITYAGWAPVFFNLLDIGALLLIVRTLTRDRRLIWLSIWFFYLANWVGQDYFAPQSLTYSLYLVVVGIALNWFRILLPPSEAAIRRWLRSERLSSWLSRIMDRSQPDEDAPAASASPLQNVGFVVITVLSFVVIVSTHQLTPLAMFVSFALLVIFQIVTLRSLPILILVLTATWFIYVADPFMSHSLYWIVRSIGSFLGNFGANFINLAEASPGQALVATIDRALSALVVLLAIYGFSRRVRRGRWDLPAILLLLAPFPLLAANSYGGEIVFRVYLFALPFLAFFAAASLYPALGVGSGRGTAIASTLLSFVLLAGLLFGYYGKERQYYFTGDEVAAAEFIHDYAPAQSLLVDAAWGHSLQYRNYEDYDYLSLVSMLAEDRQALIANPVGFLTDTMEGYPTAYLVLSRSQEAAIDMTGAMPAGSLQEIKRALLGSPGFKAIYSKPDATVFVLASQTRGVPQ